MAKISKKQIGLGAAGVIVLLLVIQFIPTERSNPPVTSEIAAPPEVAAILQRACYDCHSNKTEWPWYSRVAPLSWRIAKDVAEAREEMNFTEWDALTPRKQLKMQENCWDEIEEGKMPPSSYALMHAEARLTVEDMKILEAWGKDSEKSHDELRDKEAGDVRKGEGNLSTDGTKIDDEKGKNEDAKKDGE